LVRAGHIGVSMRTGSPCADHASPVERSAGFSACELFLLAAGTQGGKRVGNRSGSQVFKTADEWVAPLLAHGVIEERDR